MRTSIFATCLADQFFADAVADTVRLLRSLGVEVDVPDGQTCCGQPAYSSGFRDEARRMASHTAHVFRDSQSVVLPSGSCAAMLRVFYPDLLGDAAAPLAGRTFELSQFLVNELGVRHLGTGLAGRRIAWHHGCHALRELGLEREATDLLAASGAELVPWEADRECCGFGGTFSVRHGAVSAGMADRKLDTLPEVDCLTSTDPGCLLQLAGRARARGRQLVVRHLGSLLWEARSGTGS